MVILKVQILPEPRGVLKDEKILRVVGYDRKVSVHSRNASVQVAKTRNKHCFKINVPFIFTSAHWNILEEYRLREPLRVHVCGREAERKRCETYFLGLFLKSFFGRKIIMELKSFVAFQQNTPFVLLRSPEER